MYTKTEMIARSEHAKWRAWAFLDKARQERLNKNRRQTVAIALADARYERSYSIRMTGFAVRHYGGEA